MMKISILGGAGLMGAGIARDLISDRSDRDIQSIRICDVARQRVDDLIRDLGDPRLKGVTFDASDSAQLKSALNGSDLCINAVPTLAQQQMAIFEAAFEVGCRYVDLGGLGVYTTKQKMAHERFRDAGVTAVIGVGADPGMSNVICRAVADELDRIDRINLYWAAELVGPENPVLVPPYSLSTVLAEYSYPSTQFLDGRHVEVEPRTGHESLDLPEPWGLTEFMYSPHSEPLTVPLAEGIRDKGIREFTWKLHLPHREHQAWIGLIKAGFGDFELPVKVGSEEIKPLDFLNAMIRRNREQNGAIIPRQESHEIHLAIAHGKREGKPCTARCEVIAHPDSMYDGYVDAATSMNASISAQLLLRSDPKPGVWAPEEYFNVTDYFDELKRRNFNVSVSLSTEDD